MGLFSVSLVSLRLLVNVISSAGSNFACLDAAAFYDLIIICCVL